jgi:carbamoylphosphate synthase large subunit
LSTSNSKIPLFLHRLIPASVVSVVVSVGGQIPNNLALPLHRKGVRILGTSPEDIDRAEDRGKFSALMDAIGVRQPAWSALSSEAAALAFAARVGYPVLVRPSYVLGGRGMEIVYDDATLSGYVDDHVFLV